MNERFPHLREKFEIAASIPATERYDWAMEQLKELPRTGYAFHGVPDEHVETIHGHIKGMHHLSNNFSHKAVEPWLDYIVNVMIDAHRLPAAITHDFHHHDKITKLQKSKLENSAMKILLKCDSEKTKHRFDMYKKREHPAALWVKDLNYLQYMERTLKYQLDFPELRNALEEFWDDAHKKPMHTEQGTIMIADLLQRKAALKIGL